MSDVNVLSFRAFENPPLKGFADIELFGCVILKSVKLMENSDGELWLAMPSIKQGDDWQNTVYISDEALRDEMLDIVVGEYESAPKPDSSTRSRRRSNSSRNSSGNAGNGTGQRRRSVRTSSRRKG